MTIEINTGNEKKDMQIKKFINKKLIPFMKEDKHGFVAAHVRNGIITYDEIRETDNQY